MPTCVSTARSMTFLPRRVRRRSVPLRSLGSGRRSISPASSMRSSRLVIVERGFDGVTVSEIARAAELSEMTVFNYFPTKEDLVFGRMEFFEEQLVAAVQQRAPEESAVAAFGRMVLADIDQLAARTEMIAKAAMLIRASLALQAREREITARYTARLAGVFTAETGSADDDIEAWTAASALMAVHRGLLEHVRNAVLAGRRGA